MTLARRLPRPAALAAALWLLVPPAAAHDSWLALAGDPPGPGLLRLDLGVGARFPVREGGTPRASVGASGCRQATGPQRVLALQPRQEKADGLELRARLEDASATACWVALKPNEVSLQPALVAVYLDEVRAPPAVRGASAAQQARGVLWREVYRKSIRIELPGGSTAGESLAALRRSEGLGLELVPVGAEPLRAGQPARFQALLEGKPVPGLPVEFVSERSALGIWRETDAAGQLSLTLPFGGHWLLRATRIEPPADDAQPWRSEFATLSVYPQ